MRITVRFLKSRPIDFQWLARLVALILSLAYVKSERLIPQPHKQSGKKLFSLTLK